jgi:hypothetical protein
MKKLALILLLIPALSWAQNSTDQQKSNPDKAAEEKPTEVKPATQEKQEENPNAVKNDYPIGPFDRDGKYNFLFDKKDEGQQ